MSAPRERRGVAWSLLAILAAVVAAYHNSLYGPFVFDDASSILTNPTIRKLWPLRGPLSPPESNVTAQGRPVLNLSLAINYALGGTAVEGYHLGNLVIHALAALTLFGVVRRTLAQLRQGQYASAGESTESVALAVSVLWAVHPLQTESVTYVIQRAESLVGLFYLLTLYAFIRAAAANDQTAAGRASRTRWLVLSVFVCLTGMATKEVMVTAPLMVLFFDRCFFARTFAGALRRRAFYYLGLAATWILLAALVAQAGGNRGGSVGFGSGVGWLDYALTQFQAVGHYLRLALWPSPLVFEYGSFWIQTFDEIAVHAVIVLGLLTATVVLLWKRSPLGFLGAWFFGILAPTSLAPGTTQMIVEHRMYLPLAAVVVAVVAGVQGIVPKARLLRTGVLAAAVVALVLLTVARNHDYRSDVGLWTDTVVKRPQNPLAHFMLAGAQERAGNIAAAIAGYERTLELKPDFSIAHEHYGELLLRLSRRTEAIHHLETAVRLQPEFGDARANLGNAYLAEGRISESVVQLENAVRLMPASAITRYNFGNALAAAGRPMDAIAEYERALKLQSGGAETHFNLANVLLEYGRTADAIVHYEAAVKTRAGYAAAHYNLANALAASGRQAEAVPHYEAALAARPDYPEAHHNLGSALFELGRLTDAARHYAETLRLNPDFPNARENLERVRARLPAARQ